jgi:hypothetical protein
LYPGTASPSAIACQPRGARPAAAARVNSLMLFRLREALRSP